MKPAPATLEQLPENEQVTLSSLIRTMFKNYGTYFETKERLNSLQEWVKAQQEIYNKKE